MNKIFISMAVLVVLIFSGCGAKVVHPVNKKHKLSHICIEDNPKVRVDDFIPTVEQVFNEWGISTDVYYRGSKPKYCVVKMTYTALRSWDFSPYLAHAEVRLYKGGKKIGYAEYHMKGGSMSLDLSKWAGTESKMRPILKELLSQYDKKKMAPHPRTTFKSKSTVKSKKTDDGATIEVKLKRLKKLYEDDVITVEEYVDKRKALLKKQ